MKMVALARPNTVFSTVSALQGGGQNGFWPGHWLTLAGWPPPGSASDLTHTNNKGKDWYLHVKEGTYRHRYYGSNWPRHIEIRRRRNSARLSLEVAKDARKCKDERLFSSRTYVWEENFLIFYEFYKIIFFILFFFGFSKTSDRNPERK